MHLISPPLPHCYSYLCLGDRLKISRCLTASIRVGWGLLVSDSVAWHCESCALCGPVCLWLEHLCACVCAWVLAPELQVRDVGCTQSAEGKEGEGPNPQASPGGTAGTILLNVPWTPNSGSRRVPQCLSRDFRGPAFRVLPLPLTASDRDCFILRPHPLSVGCCLSQKLEDLVNVQENYFKKFFSPTFPNVNILLHLPLKKNLSGINTKLINFIFICT